MTSMMIALIPDLSAALAPLVQAGSSSFRPSLYVFLAYGVAWLLVAVWIVLIARRVGKLLDRNPPAR